MPPRSGHSIEAKQRTLSELEHHAAGIRSRPLDARFEGRLSALVIHVESDGQRHVSKGIHSCCGQTGVANFNRFRLGAF